MSYVSRHIEGATAPHNGLVLNEAFVEAAAAFAEKGYVRFDFLSFGVAPWHVANVRRFLADAGSQLPPDPYDQSGTRRRAYSRFVWVANTGAVEDVGRYYDEQGRAFTSYMQGDEYQPEFGNIKRVFPAIRQSVATSPLLKGLIQADGSMALAAGALKPALAFLVGVHIIKLEPSISSFALVTPDEIHRDGEPVTLAHLISRENCVGGENVISTFAGIGKKPDQVGADCILDRFVLNDIGQSYAVDDARVAHYVSGVGRVATDEPGHRTIMLIDFSPLRAELSAD